MIQRLNRTTTELYMRNMLLENKIYEVDQIVHFFGRHNYPEF